MGHAVNLLADAIATEGRKVAEYRWEDLLNAVETLFASPFNWATERVMLEVLRFGGTLRLAESSELPHSMCPEDMLKSFAIQWLAKFTGLTHLLEMQRVEAMTASPSLSSIVRATIRAVTPPKLPAKQLELIPELRPSPQQAVFIEPVGRRIGKRPPKSSAGGTHKLPEQSGLTFKHYAGYRFSSAQLSRSLKSASAQIVEQYRGTLSAPPTKKKNIVYKAAIHELGQTIYPIRHRVVKRAGKDNPFAQQPQEGYMYEGVHL